MKTPFRRASPIRFGASVFFIVVATLCASPYVSARSVTDYTGSVTQSPRKQGADAPQNTNAADEKLSPRERRAQAYAKLMEGQRALIAARAGGITLDTLRQGQQAFQRAAELDPTLSEAHTALAEIAFFFLNDLAQAEREARTAMRINPDNLGAHRVLSRVYTISSNLTEGNLDRAAAESAIAELREVLRLHANDAEAWALLGEFYLATGREREAVEAFTRWGSAPVPIDVRFYQVVSKGRELTPDVAHARLAETLMQLGQAAEAFGAAQRAWSMEPENPSYMELLVGSATQLAQSLAAEGRFDEAVKVYDDLLRMGGVGNQSLTNQRQKQFAAQTLSGIAALRTRAGQFEEAAAVVERMRLLLGAEHPSVDLQSIELLRRQGKKQEALDSARRARANHPADTRLLYREASLLAELGRVDEAVGLYRARMKGAAEDYNEYLALASILINAGHGKEAVESSQKALALAPAGADELTVQALLMLSSAQDRAGDFKGSEESLRKVLAKDPKNSTALNNLGYFLTERNERLDEALGLIQRAVKAEPQNPSFLDSLGWVYFKLGKLDEAERYLSEAARRDPNSTAIQEHLGDIFHRLGRIEQARSAWMKALNLATESAVANRIKSKLDGGSK